MPALLLEVGDLSEKAVGGGFVGVGVAAEGLVFSRGEVLLEHGRSRPSQAVESLQTGIVVAVSSSDVGLLILDQSVRVVDGVVNRLPGA